MKLATPIRNRWIFALLVGLYPSVFFASNNWYGFSWDQTGTLIVASAALSLVAVSCAASALSTLFLRSKLRAASRAADAVWALIGLSLCLGLSSHLLIAAPLSLPAVVALAAIPALGGAAWAYRSGIGGLNLLMCGLILVTTAQWGYSYIDIRTEKGAVHWYNIHRSFNDRIHFERTPNVYYLLAESYPSRAALKKIYAIRQPGFYQALKRRRFEVHHNAFSNYESTTLSMTSMFAMAHHYAKYSIGNFESYNARDVITAKVYNAVIDVFRRNGYRIEYLHEYAYQVRMGAAIDYLWPPVSVLSGLWAFLGPFGLHEEIPIERLEFAQEFGDVVDERLASVETSESPRFTYLYLGAPGHSSSTLTLADIDGAVSSLESFRRRCPKRVQSANRDLLDLVDRIIAADPDALIVVGGDHGGWGWRVERRPNGSSVPQSLVALDRLGILLAIRFPEDYDARFEGNGITNVNLFRYVFTYLSGQDEILEAKVADDGYVTREAANRVVQKALENGRILDSFVAQGP